MKPDSATIKLARPALNRIFTRLCFVTVGVGLLTAACAFAAPGAVDPAFNVNVNGAVNCAVVQPTGKILIGGAFNVGGGLQRSGFARLNPDGTLDSTITNILLSGQVNAILLQTDGKFVLAGNFTISTSSTHVDIIRLNVDGSVDGTFTNSAPNNTIYAVAQQSDGKILVGGTFTRIANSTNRIIARLNTDGTLDNSFDAAMLGNSVNAIAVQNDGNILIGGNFLGNFNGVRRYSIARLTTNGGIDLSYQSSANQNGIIQAVYLEQGGKSVWAGSFSTLANSSCHNVGRLNADGSLDIGFSMSNGPSGTLYAIAEDASNGIYVGGQFQTYNGITNESVVRLLPDGTLDTNFNNVTNFKNATNSNVPLVNCLAIQGDGRVIAGGSFNTWGNYSRRNLVQLYGTNYPAEITTQPQDTSVTLGGSSGFSVAVSNPTPVCYQWYYNGAAISGATNNQYSILNAQLSDAGTYNVYVSAGMGATASSNAVLQVTP
jgi:uncharacterized delta-60 repeat protein